jgi:hypothetical protein
MHESMRQMTMFCRPEHCGHVGCSIDGKADHPKDATARHFRLLFIASAMLR